MEKYLAQTNQFLGKSINVMGFNLGYLTLIVILIIIITNIWKSVSKKLLKNKTQDKL